MTTDPEGTGVSCPLCDCDGVVTRSEAAEYERLRVVVAAQREALRAVRDWIRFGEGSESDAAEKLDAALALDAEGVSEPGVDEKREQAGTPASADTRSRTKLPGSLTSPVDLAHVVAVQREALRELVAAEDAVAAVPITDEMDSNAMVEALRESVLRRKRAWAAVRALDAEGVSEPGGSGVGKAGTKPPVTEPPGSLTSPVVTHGRHCPCSACEREDWTRITAPCGMHGEDCPAVYAPLTSPVDTAPRGYVERGPEGPQAVYHAETPDDYLEHGDRP